MADYETWYNQSSLEDDVDKELARMQDKQAESFAANLALISQLEILNPHLASIEQQLTESKTKHKSESKLRHQSELLHEASDARAVRAETSLGESRMECEGIREKLVVCTRKGEETRLELEMERERHVVEMEEMTNHVRELTRKNSSADDGLRKMNGGSESPSIISGMTFETKNMTLESTQVFERSLSRSDDNDDGDDDEEYVKRLENELADVTEQLINAETTISDIEGQLANAETNTNHLNAKVLTMTQIMDDLHQNITESTNATNHTQAKNAVDAANYAQQEELALLTEELALTQEELKAAEHDINVSQKEFEQLQMRSKDELSTLQEELIKVRREARSSQFESTCLETALNQANTDVTPLREEVDTLTNALQSAKRENKMMVEEMTQLRQAVTRQGNDQRVALEQQEEDLVKQHDTTAKSLESIESHAGDLQRRLQQTEKDLTRATNELQTAKTELLNSECKVAELVAGQQQHSLDDEVDDTPSRTSNLEHILHSGDTEAITNEFMALAKRANAQKAHNAHLLVQILKLQGNIQVCCRIRPLTNGELIKGETKVVENLSESEVGCFDTKNRGWKSYAFDKVWGHKASQGSVFQDVEPLVLTVLDGYNACIFAYGQTGSGKTYTMEGGRGNDVGISYRTIEKVFNLLNYRKAQQIVAVREYEDANSNRVGPEVDESALPSGVDQTSEFVFSIRVGMLEIYNDGVYDLLVKSDPRAIGQPNKSLEIKRDKLGNIYVEGLTKEPVATLLDVLKLLKRGNDSRKTAATDLNEHSSRSHMVLSVEVTCGIEGEEPTIGTLFLVDLAGSERVRKSAVVGENLKEATHINKSLSALGNVMEALDKKTSHVPYRDSKLTYLLQDSLGGNSRTMMVVTVCPTNITLDETQNALQFATRVRRIHIGTAKKNVTSKNLEETVKALTSELKTLAQSKERAEEQVTLLRRDHSRIQDRLKSSSENRSKAQDHVRTVTVLKQSNAQMTVRWQKEKQLHGKTLSDLEAHQNDAKRTQQQLSKATRECARLGNLMEEREGAQLILEDELRKANDASSAANRRARKTQMLQSRPTTDIPRKIKAEVNRSAVITPRPTTVPTVPTEEMIIDPQDARRKVLKMLEVYDNKNIDKIDAIMERFKGRESFLLKKLTARYGKSKNISPVQVDKLPRNLSSKSLNNMSSNNSVSSMRSMQSVKSMNSAAKNRSKMALAKHREQTRIANFR